MIDLTLISLKSRASEKSTALMLFDDYKDLDDRRYNEPLCDFGRRCYWLCLERFSDLVFAVNYDFVSLMFEERSGI